MSSKEGVYLFIDENREVLYVGKAKNLKKRVSSYFLNKDLGPKTQALVGKIKKVKTVPVDSEIEALLLEANLIKKYNPKYNARLTDGKSYIRAKITNGEKIPKVLLARREEDGKSIYFGPYPSSNDLKVVMKLIRKIFPYQSVVNHPKRYCLYHHLDLCPCPPMFKNKQELREYRKNIKHIIHFFEGKAKKIIKDLEKDRDKQSRSENFEKAAQIQQKIDAILLITSPRRSPFEYEQNPNLRSDLRTKELSELQKTLQLNGVGVKSLFRIECYDISNIGGIHATGSMVVFINGEKDVQEYRRFQIKRPPRVIPNDFAMIREVIKRRLNHKDWEFPNLIIVDGGKGQVSVVNKALFEENVSIPVIGIAKREELLITSDFKIIRFSHSSPALILVRRIRDEAHRFALVYHRKLRSKFILTPGV
ncbi:MAG: GIY-YIG nuclease family protein [Candidatus Levybacteria bacterium]|nr:GIY-YIG nuclease family protein [Candidatus Levybacteria bacterium]